MKTLVKISFLGSSYCGYQVQPNGVSVEEKIQDAIEALYGARLPVTGCSRTDSGVHAAEFYFTFDPSCASNRVPTEKVPDALNRYLPEDISAHTAKEVDDSFHPRYSCKGKEYVYRIWNGRSRNPFFAATSYHFPSPLDEKKMARAAAKIPGRRDFSAFCAAGSSVDDKVRTVFSCDVSRDGDLVEIKVSGDGFLYNMVRIICGTLIEVSSDKIDSEEIGEIILSKDRSRAGFTAPAKGLILNRVFY